MEEKSIFETLSAIDVSKRTEERDNLTYLSWSWAWQTVKEHYPTACYDIERDPVTRLPYFKDEKLGVIVMTSVTIGSITHMMWLPVMDSKNKAMREVRWTYKTKFGEKTVEPVTMFEVNKALMRCLVKNLAMFGLGLYIYAGEDLPEVVKEQKEKEEQEREAAEAAKALSDRVAKGKKSLMGISPWTEETLEPVLSNLTDEQKVSWLKDAYREAKAQMEQR